MPRDHDHHVSLAVALQRSKRHEEAIRAFFDALALKMDDAVSHFRLGMSFKDLGMKAEAAECVRTAVLLGLDSSELCGTRPARLPRARGLPLDARPTRRSPGCARRCAPSPPRTRTLETSPFAHAVLTDDPLEQLEVSRRYAQHVARLYPPLPRIVARARDGRLRVGYLSADFHQHATSQLMAQMLECHDRSAFEVTLLSAGPLDDSPMRRRLVAGSEHFEELRGKSFQAMAARIRELGIDLLVDLKGATYDTLLPVLAQRPAPLQVTWLGFPGTTGAPYIDYLIGDRVVTPLADAAHFSEKIAQLPHCYQPNDARRALPQPSTRADWGVPEDALLLCAFHQSYKISAAGVRPVVRAAARAAGLGALAAAMEHQRPGDADEGRGRARHRRRAPGLRAAACRSRAISAASPTPTSISTPGRAMPTPPPARRSGSACRW